MICKGQIATVERGDITGQINYISILFGIAVFAVFSRIVAKELSITFELMLGIIPIPLLFLQRSLAARRVFGGWYR